MRKSINKLKKILAFSLAVFMGVSILGLSINADAAKKKSNTGTYAEGDDIQFGSLDRVPLSWTILSYDDTTKIAFVVSRKPISSEAIYKARKDIADYYSARRKTPGYVRWSDSIWRTWLNKLFYKNCFTDEEREKIQKTKITADSQQTSLMNFYHDTSIDNDYVKNGNVKGSLNMDIYESQTPSTDYLFFLSTDEYVQYKDKIKTEVQGYWPLRTNSYDDKESGLFVDDTKQMVEKGYVYGGDSIRVAMYVKLGVPEETTSDSTSKDTKTSKTTDTKSTTKTSTTTNTASNTTTNTSTATSQKASTSKSTKASSSKKYANNGTSVGNIYLPDDSEFVIPTGANAQIAIDMDYLNSTDKDFNVTYKTSDASIFTVDSNGLVTGVGVGSATLTVRMKKSNGKVYTMSCRIDVT